MRSISRRVADEAQGCTEMRNFGALPSCRRRTSSRAVSAAGGVAATSRDACNTSPSSPPGRELDRRCRTSAQAIFATLVGRLVAFMAIASLALVLLNDDRGSIGDWAWAAISLVAAGLGQSVDLRDLSTDGALVVIHFTPLLVRDSRNSSTSAGSSAVAQR